MLEYVVLSGTMLEELSGTVLEYAVLSRTVVEYVVLSGTRSTVRRTYCCQECSIVRNCALIHSIV